MIITTAIDYTNGSPHIGHAYEKILADVLTRYQKLKGNPVHFLTGVDQHGQKIQQTAEKENISPQAYVQNTTKKFLSLWEKLDVQYDTWAETTAPQHISCVQAILQKLYDEGQIYKKNSSGHYSIRQEQFLLDKDRNADGTFDEEWGEVIEIDEENYYFRLSQHTPWLRQVVESDQLCILPSHRKGEILASLDRTDSTDLCISRPKKRLHWGIPLPFDADYVTYVWFDALINYLSFTGYHPTSPEPKFQSLWSSESTILQIIGKDILIPAHAIYWPIILHAIGIPDEQLPTLLVHGWWNIKSKHGSSKKMSKSLGNVISPEDLVDQYGVNALRYYLMRDMNTGQDSDFDLNNRLITLHNTELSNDLGNLLNRTLNMSHRYFQSILQTPTYQDQTCADLQAQLSTTLTNYQAALDAHNPSKALKEINAFIRHGNRFAEHHKPWEIAKDDSKKDQLATVINHLTQLCAHASILLSPVLPEAATHLQNQLNATHLTTLTIGNLSWELLPPNHQTQKPHPAFPRLLPPTDTE